eukprot:2008165-Prymnesium_polylepis.1
MTGASEYAFARFPNLRPVVGSANEGGLGIGAIPPRARDWTRSFSSHSGTSDRELRAFAIAAELVSCAPRASKLADA